MNISNIKDITSAILTLISLSCRERLLYINMVTSDKIIENAQIKIKGRLKIPEKMLPNVPLISLNENNFNM